MARRNNPYRDDGEIAAATARIVRSLGRRLASSDPEELVHLRALEEELERAWSTAIAGMRRTGYSDAQIGEALSISKQAVQQRFPRHDRKVAAQ